MSDRVRTIAVPTICKTCEQHYCECFFVAEDQFGEREERFLIDPVDLRRRLDELTYYAYHAAGAGGDHHNADHMDGYFHALEHVRELLPEA